MQILSQLKQLRLLTISLAYSNLTMLTKRYGLQLIEACQSLRIILLGRHKREFGGPFDALLFERVASECSAPNSLS